MEEAAGYTLRPVTGLREKCPPHYGTWEGTVHCENRFSQLNEPHLDALSQATRGSLMVSPTIPDTVKILSVLTFTDDKRPPCQLCCYSGAGDKTSVQQLPARKPYSRAACSAQDRAGRECLLSAERAISPSFPPKHTNNQRKVQTVAS